MRVSRIRRNARSWITAAALTAGAIGLESSHALHAATVTWDGGGGNAQWQTANNWSGNALPTTGDDVVLGAATLPTVMTTAGFNQTMRSITLSVASSGSFQLANSAGNNGSGNTSVITLSGDASGMVLTLSSAFTGTFNIDPTIAGSRTLTLNLGTSGSSGTINVASSSANLSISTTIGESASGKGITKSGAGKLTLTGDNSFSGSVSINNGTLSLGTISTTGTNQAWGSGTSAVTLGSASTGATLSYTGADGSSNRAITIGGAGGGTIETLNSGSTLTLTGGINTNGAAVTFAGAGNSTVTTTAISGSGSLTKNGSGTLTLSAANSFGGAVTINNGGVVINTVANTGSNQSLGTASSALTLGSSTGATLSYTGSSNSTNRAITIGGAGGGTIESTTNTLTLTGGINTNGAPLTIGGAGNVTMSTNAISGTGSLTKNGAGILTLSANNTFSGGVAIGNGTVSINNIDNTGVAQPLGQGSATITLGSAATAGALSYTAAGLSSTGRAVLVGGAGGGVIESTSGTLVFTGTINTNGASLRTDGAGTVSFADLVSGSGSITKNGSGTLNLLANNTFTGAVTINNGVVAIENVANIATAQSLGQGASAVTLGSASNSGRLLYGGFLSGSTNRALNIGGAGGGIIDVFANTLTLTGGIGGSGPLTVTGSGSLTVSTMGIGSSVTNLTKSGGGVLTLASGTTSNYSGTTSISAGRYTVHGTLSSGGLITVGTGSPNTGQLSGSGTLGRAVSITNGGGVDPGDYGAVGKLSTTANFTLASGAKMQIELGGNAGTIGTAGTHFDQIALSGSGVSFTTGGATLVVIPLSSAVVGQPYPIVKATSPATINFTTVFANLPENTVYDQGLGIKYKLNYSSGEIDLTFTSVPEPTGAAVMVITGGIGLPLRNRRGRRERAMN